MAIKTQEITLRIVFDDTQVQADPVDWPWQRSLVIGHASVNNAFVVTAVRSSTAQPATSDDVKEFEDE